MVRTSATPAADDREQRGGGCNVDLRGANLTYVTFEQERLSRSDLTGADLTGAHFNPTDTDGLKAADVDGCPVVLPPGWACVPTDTAFVLASSVADLEDANLWGAAFTGLDLRGIVMTRARARGISLVGADLSGARMQYILFGFAALNDANFTDADLSYASFYGDALAGANLLNANLYRASTANIASCPATLPDARWRCLPNAEPFAMVGPGAQLYGLQLTRSELVGN